MNKFADSNKLRKIFHLHSINVNRTKRFFKNVLAISSAFAVFFSSCPICSVKAETVGGFIIEGGTSDTDYTYENNVLTIKSSTPMTIQNIDPNTPTTDRIEINSEANLTLAGVNIATNTGAAMKIQDDATFDVNILLADGSENILTGKLGDPYDCSSSLPGIQKSGDTGVGTLTITGSTKENAGILTATGGAYAAGIGSRETASNITINGGIVTVATAGFYAVGIGAYGNASNITINGGIVTATGGYGGAGIGGGEGSTLTTNITITGGTVIATGGVRASGIGNGCKAPVVGPGYEGNVSGITISGGTVIATGGAGCPGIGAGEQGYANNITISGGTITSIGGSGAVAIGGAGGGANNNSISGDAVVMATSGDASKPALEGFGAASGESIDKGIVFERQTESEDYT